MNMKKIGKRFLAVILSLGTILSNLTPVLADVDISGEGDDREVKYFIKDIFSNILTLEGKPVSSGWDLNLAGGTAVTGGLTLVDSSTVLPVEASRQLEPITYGKVVMDSPILFTSAAPGTRLMLKNGELPVVEYYFGTDTIQLRQADGTYLSIANYQVNARYNLRTEMDFDSGIISVVYLNGEKVCENIPFASEGKRADSFFFTTGRETTGSVRLCKLLISRGYWINDFFDMSSQCVPDDWAMTINGQKVNSDEALLAGNIFNGDYAVLNSKQGATVLSKTIPSTQRDNIFEFQLLAPQKRPGAEVQLVNGGNTVFSVQTDENGFSYADKNGQPIHFYDSWDNVWYHFRIETDFTAQKADLYMNERLMIAGIPLGDAASAVDGVQVVVEPEADGDIWFTGVQLYPKEEFEDYVPEPVKPEKNCDIELGMQMCPMWSEGWHRGWDYINAAEGRHPLLGFYDEGDPEAADWQIKWMVEHGIDFQWYCWYPLGNPPAPLNDTDMSPALNGIRRAKYNDKIKFAIMMENAGVHVMSGTIEENQKLFFETIVPFWIEHYFKHPSYYKINGRPVVGIYYFWYVSFLGDFKSVLEKFRQMCIDAGVGNPYFIQQYGIGSSDVETIDSWGVDAIYQYAIPWSYQEAQYQNNLNGVAQLEGKNLKWIPNATAGYDIFPWNDVIGATLSKEQYKELLENLKENFWQETGMNVLGKKVLMLSSWDEYAEGHYISPTTGHGFEYLDAIREVFVGDQDENANLVPTEQQKDRFNNWYPADRTVQIREKIRNDTIPENSYLKKAWNFDASTEGWMSGNAEKMEIEDGNLKISGSGTGIQLTAYPEDLEISDVTHIKLRIKTDSAPVKIMSVFNLDPEPVYSTEKRTFRNIDAGQEDYTDIIIDMSMYPLWWRGILKDINFYFEGLDKIDTIWIDSIEMYAQPQDEDKTVLNYLGREQRIETIIRNGQPMIPIRTIADIAISDVYWDNDQKIAYMKYNGEIAAGADGSFSIDANQQAGCSELENGTMYLSLEAVAQIFDLDIKWNPEENVISMQHYEQFEMVRPNTERELIYSLEFNTDGNAEGCYALSAISNMDVSNGCLNISYAAGDPIVGMPTPAGLDTSKVKLISVGLKSNASFTTIIYYGTDIHPGISEAQVIGFNVQPGNEIQEYTIDPTESSAWEGNLSTWRLDPGDNVAATTSIDYIRFYGDFDYDISDEELANRYDAMTVTDAMTAWEMDINNSRDGWEFNKNMANIWTDSGFLNMQILQTDAAMYTAGLLDISTEDVREIQIRMKNQTDGDMAKLYYALEDMNGFDETHMISIPIQPQDAVGNVYTVQTAQLPEFDGKITGLKLMPANEKGVISIDYIRLIK